MSRFRQWSNNIIICQGLDNSPIKNFNAKNTQNTTTTKLKKKKKKKKNIHTIEINKANTSALMTRR